MKHTLLLTLFSLILVGLISSCSKKEDVVAPVSPLVGQWDINRVITLGIPNSYTSAQNQNGTRTANLGTDTYIFKNDGTFLNNYLNSSSATVTDAGTWALANTFLTLTVTSQSPPSAYILTYAASANELTTGAVSISPTVTNPTTGATERITYTQEIVYRKKS